MTPLKTAAALLALLLSLHASQAQVLVLTNFGNTATNGGGWTYTAATSTISGTEGIGDSIFGVPLTSNIGTDRFLQLTGDATVAPAGSFSITIEDNLGHTAIAHFQWDLFVGGATQTRPIESTTFNFGNVTAWSLDSGGSLQSVNASFSQLAAVAVPEPSACLLFFAAFSVLWITRKTLIPSRISAEYPSRLRLRPRLCICNLPRA